MSKAPPGAVESVARMIFGATDDHMLRALNEVRAETALVLIRDAIHRDGSDAEAIREALGLKEHA